ncbi:two pore potassium channel protein sup-9-like isoform X1 [Stylophora pistillata]|uniref:Potassium channel subfamily K member 3 n=1 Tax=Stylophora pistillata TaxID=50429 RepID=A0A2B4R7X7_STYPI|nr:two pore potassium channel protein sup-9-like isoform X1 [Stylophora pistillata]PFX12939.1 Potassium channel subfamily K member 3 [Stylophora pistillata]
MALNFTSDTKRLICLAILLGIYLLSGAVVFQVLENENDKLEIQELNSMKKFFLEKHNMTPEDFDLLVEKVENAVKHRCGGDPDQWCTSRWTYYASLYFTWSVVTTVGYGHLAPSTVGGRVFCMVFALFGIPLNLMVLRHIGDRVNQLISYIHFLVETKLLKRESQPVVTKTLMWTLFALLIMLIVGAFLYLQEEQWNFLEGVYFCFITFSTIGFGDLVPNGGQAPSDVGSIIMELLRATVVLLGVSMFFSIITSVLTASEELRVNFPAEKDLDALRKKSENSLGSGEIEGQDKVKSREEKRIQNDVESGNIDDVKDVKSTKTGHSLTEPKRVGEKFGANSQQWGKE